MRVHRSATKTARRSGAALLQADPLIHPLLPIRLAYPSAPRHAWPTGFRLAQYDLALRRFLRLSELAIGDDYGAAILAPAALPLGQARVRRSAAPQPILRCRSGDT